jgi:DNA-binding NtrC family response regulator
VNDPRGRGRILCVDDEPHVLRALQWLLEKDFTVHTCGQPVDALPLLRSCDFDVVVSDQRMPGVSGVEFLAQVKTLAPRAMRILLTGYADLDAMMQSVNEGEVYRFITKPWDVQELPKLLAQAVRAARGQSEPAPCDGSAAPRPRVRLLVIDDDPDLHWMVEDVLGEAAEVLHAYDLEAAHATLEARKVGVVLSELAVGGLDATRLLRKVKEAQPELVTLVASTRRDADTVMKLINEGQVFRIVPKPIKPAFVKVLVEAAVQRHRELKRNPALLQRVSPQPQPAPESDSLFRDIFAIAASRRSAAKRAQG